MHASVDCITSANHFYIDHRLTIVVIDIHAAGNETAEVFHFTNIRFQLFIVAQEIFGSHRGLTITKRIKRNSNDSRDKEQYQKCNHAYDAKNYENQFAVGHQSASSGGSAVEVKASKIVD